MNEKLHKKINESVDLLIDNVNNNSKNKENLNEGVLGNILYFLNLAGLPKHKKFKLYQKHYLGCINSCEKTYAGEKTVYTSKKDAYTQMDKTKENDLKDSEKMDEEMIKENPEKAKCITRCRISFLKNVINLIKEEGEDKICAKNMSKSACKKWVENTLPDMEIELEYLDKAVNKINKSKNEKQIQNVLSKINKTFYEK